MTDTLSGDGSLELPEFDAPPPSPLDLARSWLDAAADHDVSEPLAMTLATASTAGGALAVHARTVLVKRIDDRGLVFGSSRVSRKGADLVADPAAALQVYWRETMQQLRFEGRVVVLSDRESDELFADRAPKSRAATAVARQSAPLTGDRTLDTLVSDADALLERTGDDVPRPADWVAWRLEPTVVEFWHGSRDRMHRRIEYRADGDGWTVQRLEP